MSQGALTLWSLANRCGQISAGAELHALQQLRDANTANTEKITKLNEKHQSELKMLQQEISAQGGPQLNWAL